MPRTSGWARSGAPPGADEDVVAVERDVHRAEQRLEPAAFGDELAQPAGERDAACVDPDEREGRDVAVSLDQLVREPGKRARQAISVEDLAPRRGRSRAVLHRSLLSGLAGPG